MISIPASFRGIPFAVNSIATKLGRRTVLHEYPFRDDVWAEDLGRAPRVFQVSGFLADSAGGFLAEAARDALALACERKTPGTFTHPTFGIFTVALVSFITSESKDSLGSYSVDFEFVQTAEPQFPGSKKDTVFGLSLGSLNLLDAGGSDFAASIIGYIGLGAAVLAALPGVIASFAAIPQTLTTAAAGIIGSVRGVAGSFGRFDNGGLEDAPPAEATATSQLAIGVAAQQSLVTALAAANAKASTGLPSDIATAAGTITAAVRASANDPADQINALVPLLVFTAPVSGGSDAIAVGINICANATAALCRVSALAEVGNAIAAYRPTSYDDAVARQTSVVALIDSESLIAADSGDAATYSALRALRSDVIDLLAARGASLAPLRTYTLSGPMPALAVAQRLYEDGARAADLIARANPIHPAFMPAQFVALAR